jgi:hypothetical protein
VPIKVNCETAKRKARVACSVRRLPRSVEVLVEPLAWFVEFEALSEESARAYLEGAVLGCDSRPIENLHLLGYFASAYHSR